MLRFDYLGAAAVPFAFLRYVVLLSAMSATPVMATTWFVRADGGSPAQCTGTTNAAYSGGGQNQACALAHPFYLLPPTGIALMQGGDTLRIGPGQYRMGIGAPATSGCSTSAPWNCTLASVPAGSASNPTRIIGQHNGGQCLNPPQLWGTERARQVLNLSDTSNVELSCLEITDHSNCIDGGPLRACRRSSAPYGNWAQAGLRMEDATAVTITDLNIHGLANTGIRGGRLTDVSFYRVKVNGNAWSGLDWDLGSGSSSNSGTILFDNVEIGYNGCAEGYPTISDNFCWAQIEGGYGDGFGSSSTGGTFIVRDSYIHHNTSDGFDFLYADNSAQLQVIRSRFVANAGNQLKTSGNTSIDSSEIIAECAFFEGVDYMRANDNCRARGNAMSLNFYRGATINVTNSTITSEGDCLIVSSCRDDSCNGTETLNIRNNIFFGQIDWYQPSQKSCLVYAINQPGFQPNYDTNIVYNVKNGFCPGGNNLCTNPGLSNSSMSNFDGELTSASPAINAANQLFSSTRDVRNRARPTGSADIGANEFAAGLGATTLISPSTTSTDTPTYRWSAVSNSTWYYLWVNDSFGTPVKKWYTAAAANCASGTGVCSATPTVSVNADVVWWVRTWNGNGGGPWSESLRFSVAPGQVTLLTPAAAGAGNTPTYRWDASPNATWYKLWVNDSSGNVINSWISKADANCANGTGTCTATPTTTVNGASRWWIRTWNRSGFGDWSAVKNFSP